jgi:putative PEP-CTERM system histidine kinase
METYSFFSYLTATAAYFLLFVLALLRARKDAHAVSFAAAVFFSLLWSGYTAYAFLDERFFSADSLPFETLRNAAWFFFLWLMLATQLYGKKYALVFRSKPAIAIWLLTAGTFILEITKDGVYPLNQILGFDFRVFAHVLFAVIGLILIEQLIRNAAVEQRWAVKFLCLGLGSLFVFDFIIYSKSLLFAKLDSLLWETRGLINAVTVPLLAIATTRLGSAVKGSVSRAAVFHTTVLFGTGAYLILMSLLGFYIRYYGGNWGKIAQVVFIFLAVVLLLILLFSGKIRAWIKVYFNKHFLQHHYDYREEWIKLSRTIANLNSLNELSGFVIDTLAGLVESTGGGLWLKNEQGDFYLVEAKNQNFQALFLIAADDPVIRFFNAKQWVIDVAEFESEPEMYDDLDLSNWLNMPRKIWLIIPLFRQNDLQALAVLGQARTPRRLNWEDHDLLKTVGMQLANALALNQTGELLSRARQFEAYHRLSAYIVHDLKNLLAQISLIVKNAEKHKRNPEFIDDSIETLENVVRKMQHLMGQLKKENLQSTGNALVDLAEIVHDVGIQQAANEPPVQTLIKAQNCPIYAEKERMTAILGHLVQNAQEATDAQGSVELELVKQDGEAVVNIKDTGIGMDEKFIAERLFKPFETTKGNAGMGIGVYEARDYILKCSGQISVRSEPGKGTVFTIKLPLAKQKASDATGY